MDNQTTDRQTAFESTDCSRCGGSGRYSWCQMYGDRCFKCSGRGWTYTKRGSAATEMYAASLKVAASEVVVGQLVRTGGVPGMFPSVWITVTDIESSGTCYSYASKANGVPAVIIHGVDKRGQRSGLTVAIDDRVRIGWSGEAKTTKVAAAQAFEATLTKTGTVRKAVAR